MTIVFREYRPGRWVKIVNGAAAGPATAEEVAAWREGIETGEGPGMPSVKPWPARVEELLAEVGGGDPAEGPLESEGEANILEATSLSRQTPRKSVPAEGDPAGDRAEGGLPGPLLLWIQNENGQDHRSFLQTWGLPRYLKKMGRPCTLVLCHPEDIDALENLPAVKVRAVTTVHRGTFMLGEEQNHEK